MRPRCFRGVVLGLVCLGLAACQTPARQAPTAVSQPQVAEGTVPADAVAKFFVAACIGTAPAFDDAEGRFAKAGLQQASTGTYYHRSGTLSAKVATLSSNAGRPYKRCSVVYEAPDPAAVSAVLDAVMLDLTKAEPTAFPYQGTKVDGWKLRVEGISGVIYHKPYGSETDLGNLFADFALPL